MKILFVIGSLEAGGAERVTTLLANYWARSGHDVAILTMADVPDFYPLAPGVIRHRLQGVRTSAHAFEALIAAIRRIIAVRRTLKRERPDIAISMMTGWNVELALATRGLAVRTLGSERVHPPTVPLSPTWEWLRKATYRRLDVVVAQTDKSRSWIEANTGAAEVRVIPNPVELPDSTGLASLPALPAAAKVVLGVGRLVDQKRFDRLIAAMAQPQIGSDWHLVIVGEGPLRPTLEAQVEAVGLTGRVHLPGRSTSVHDWYRRADVYALSSDFEGFPNALLEAMAWGLPVVATDCDTGPADMIDDGRNGLLVSHGDDALFAEAIARLVGDPEARARLGSAALGARERYAIDRIAAQWEEAMR